MNKELTLKEYKSCLSCTKKAVFDHLMLSPRCTSQYGLCGYKKTKSNDKKYKLYNHKIRSNNSENERNKALQKYVKYSYIVIVSSNYHKLTFKVNDHSNNIDLRVSTCC